MRQISDIAFTPSVQSVQKRLGSRTIYENMKTPKGWPSAVTQDLAAFIGRRESFYLGTASAEGRPYIQHRGGPRGFLKVLDEKTLAFADYSGNLQYISMGNLEENDKVFLFLMDYPNRKRIKIWGRARVIEDNPDMLAKVSDPQYKATPERVFVIHVEAWNMNCPQHIQPRYTVEELQEYDMATGGR